MKFQCLVYLTQLILFGDREIMQFFVCHCYLVIRQIDAEKKPEDPWNKKMNYVTEEFQNFQGSL